MTRKEIVKVNLISVDVRAFAHEMDSITDFERGQWSVIQNVIGYVENYSLAAELCREAGIGYKKIKALQKDCGYSYKEEVNNFLKESLKLEE